MNRRVELEPFAGAVDQLDPEVAAIVPTFLETLDQEIKEMLQSLQRSEFEPIRFWGHSLDGVGIAHGFEVITKIGRSIEKAAIDQDLDQVRTLIDQLTDYVRSVRAA